MGRIKINDLPDSMTFTKKEMKHIFGGPNRREHDHIGTFLPPVDYELTIIDPLSIDGGIVK